MNLGRDVRHEKGFSLPDAKKYVPYSTTILKLKVWAVYEKHAWILSNSLQIKYELDTINKMKAFLISTKQKNA